MDRKMKFIFIQILVLVNTLFAQPHIQWINRTGTTNDSIFNSRVYFHPNHFYGPLTKYKYFPYERYYDEFELNRLKIQQERYEKLFNSIWKTGFLLQLPLKAEGQTNITSVAVVGKYNFTSQYFPLNLQTQSVEFQLTNNEADLQKLYKQGNIKEYKFTDLGRVVFRLQPIDLLQQLMYINISNKYAESFKQSVIYGLIGIEFVVEFQPTPVFYTKQTEKEHFIEFRKKFNLSINVAKEKYLKQNRAKPLELLHMIELKYKIIGFRIIDSNSLILFEFLPNSIQSVNWVQDSSSLKANEFIIINEKNIDSSLSPYSVNSWFYDAVVDSYKLEKKRTLMERKFGSWWECDLYLKLQGKRMPSLIELNEAFLQFNFEIVNYVVSTKGVKYDIGREITLTRGHYNDDRFVYRYQGQGHRNPSDWSPYYNDGFWYSNSSYFRGVIK